jgi:hypothetical protein
VQWVAKPFVDVRATAVQSMVTGSEVAMTYSTADENTGGMWSAAAPDRVTCTRAGVYLVSVVSSFASASGGSRIVVVYRNTTSVRSFAPNVVGVANSEMYAFPVRLAVGDYLRVTQYQSSGAAINTHTQSYPRLSAAML